MYHQAAHLGQVMTQKVKMLMNVVLSLACKQKWKMTINASK